MDILKFLGINNDQQYKKWIKKNHPDKIEKDLSEEEKQLKNNQFSIVVKLYEKFKNNDYMKCTDCDRKIENNEVYYLLHDKCSNGYDKDCDDNYCQNYIISFF